MRYVALHQRRQHTKETAPCRGRHINTSQVSRCRRGRHITAHALITLVGFHHLAMLVVRVLGAPVLHVLMHLVYTLFALLGIGLAALDAFLGPGLQGRALVRVSGTPFVKLRRRDLTLLGVGLAGAFMVIHGGGIGAASGW